MHKRNLLQLLTVLIFALSITGCAGGRRPIPAGVIPEQQEVPMSEEQYGHEVLSKLSEQYPLDRNDDRINRARDIVARLTQRSNQNNVWHVYVLTGDRVVNAAATRGNYIFVWTGMLKTVKSNDELASVLAHEIAHVLAGHTQPTPAEEASQIFAQISSTAAKQAIYAQGAEAALASLAGVLVAETMEALLVNPEAQRKELEADMIGLYLMADSGYNPELSVQFWERVQNDPSFANSTLQFLSSHPSSDERIAHLKRHLPDALTRYRASGRDSFALPPDQYSRTAPPRGSGPRVSGKFSRDGKEIWSVVEAYAPVYAQPDRRSTLLLELPSGEEVVVEEVQRRWLVISSPVRGYMPGYMLAPAR
jgi:predicted Zn-dependent protease